MLQVEVAFVCVLSILATSAYGNGLLLSVQQRIYGGYRALPGQFPYQASLRINRAKGLRHKCGGTIITNRFIVTAAHCIPSSLINSPRQLRIVVGGHNKTDNNDGVIYEIERVFVHHGWNLSIIIHDVALVQTMREIEFTKTINRIPISRQFVDTSLKTVTSGWGKTDVNYL